MDRTQAGVCILAAVVYVNALGAGFVYDDRRAVLTNPDVVTFSPLNNLFYSDFWGTPLHSSNSHGSYRPLCVLTFRINYWINGLNPIGYHFVNIILHSIATGLVLQTGRHVLPRRCPPIAALLFAVLPVHTEAVAGIVGRADVLASIFFLLSFIMYAKHTKSREQLLCLDFNSKLCLISFVKNKVNNANNSVTLGFRKVLFGSNVDFLMKCVSGQTTSESVKFIRVYFFLLLSVCFATCATLCKETGMTVLGVCAVYDLLLFSKYRFKNYQLLRRSSLTILAVSLCVVLCLRLQLMGARLPVFAKADNPIANNPSVLSRTLTFLYLPVENFKLLIYPRWLSFDWSMDSISAVTHISDPRNILTVVFYYVIYHCVKLSLKSCSNSERLVEHQKTKSYKRKCSLCVESNTITHLTSCYSINNNNTARCCGCARYQSTHECVLLCLAFLVVPFLPASNLPFYVGFVIAERVLYLPSIGYCFIFSIGWKILSSKLNKRAVDIFLLVLLFVSGVRTMQRNKDWMNEESLYRSGIPINPAKAYGNLGSVLSSQGRTEEAEAALKMALKHRPNMAEVHYNLGNLQRGLRKFKEAIISYKIAIQFRPSLAVAYLNLGHLLASLGEYEEAEELFLKCSRLDNTGLKDLRIHQDAKTTSLLHLGRLYFERGKFYEAVDVLKEAVATKPDNYQPQMLYGLLAEALEKTDRRDEAEIWYREALIRTDQETSQGSYLLKNRTSMLEF